mmetsp:Transcript_51833/g.85993  ORF Transcript_51833/g.85993 Transcript_51833/m.85993 type:complete len:256 (-) Transcript_51833:466-1233(-)
MATEAISQRVEAGRRALWDPSGSRPTTGGVASVLIGSLLSPWMLGLPQLTTSSPEYAFKHDLLPRVPSSQKPLLVVDVGANTGQFAISIAEAGHRGLSFEPSPTTCALLRRRIQKLKEKGVGVVNNSVRCAAVGAKRGVVQLAEETSSSASFSVRAKAKGRGGLVRVPVVRLDDEIAPSEQNFILKTDTQGFEMQVLQGAQQLLARRAARLLMVELSNGMLKGQGSSPLELMRWVAAHGYDCTHIRFFAARQAGA